MKVQRMYRGDVGEGWLNCSLLTEGDERTGESAHC